MRLYHGSFRPPATALAFLFVECCILGGCKNSTTLIESHVPASGSWKLVRNGGDGDLFGMCFVDRNHGWAVGDSGRIISTSDGGDSWTFQQSNTSASCHCVAFVNPLRGWIGAHGDSLGTTTDGGQSWRWQQFAGDPRTTLMAMAFVDENTGWVVDNFSGILHTEDGGTNWTSQVSGTRWAITSVQFLDRNEGWAVASNRVVLHTTDGGSHWMVQTLDSLDYGKGVTVTYTDIYFVSHTKGWITTNALHSNTSPHPLSVVSTSDGGKSWRCTPTPESDVIASITFTNENTGWATGASGILQTVDGGAHWSFQVPLRYAGFIEACFVNPTLGWALTYNGTVYRYQSS